MLDENRECRDIVTQIAAVTKAMEQVGFKMLASGLVSCLQDPERSAAEGYPVEEVERLCRRIAIIDEGRIIAEGTPQDLLAEAKGCGDLGTLFLQKTGEQLRE